MNRKVIHAASVSERAALPNCLPFICYTENFKKVVSRVLHPR